MFLVRMGTRAESLDRGEGLETGLRGQTPWEVPVQGRDLQSIKDSAYDLIVETDVGTEVNRTPHPKGFGGRERVGKRLEG